MFNEINYMNSFSQLFRLFSQTIQRKFSFIVHELQRRNFSFEQSEAKFPSFLYMPTRDDTYAETIQTVQNYSEYLISLKFLLNSLKKTVQNYSDAIFYVWKR